MKKKTYIFSAFSIFLTIIYFCYNITLGYDSSQYIWLSEMLAGNIDFSNWAPVRSFLFPLLIHLSNIIFGKSRYGLLLVSYIFYVCMLIAIWYMYKKIVAVHENKWVKIGIMTSIILLVVINPIIFGFYHVVLTEFVSITLSIVMSYLSWKWISLNFKENKIKYIIMTVTFVLLAICSWHLKQTYILTTIIPLLIAAIVAIIQDFNIKNIMQRVLVILFCFIGLFISIKTWNFVMKKGNVTFQDDTSSGGLLGNGFVEGISAFREEKNPDRYSRESIINDDKITQEDKDIIIDIIDGNSQEYKNFVILDRGTFINSEGFKKIIYLKEDDISTAEGISFVLKTFKEEPITVIKSYISNYLAIIDIYKVRVNVDYGNYYYIEKDFEADFDLEITFLGYNIYREMTNALDIAEFYRTYATEYISNNQFIEPINRIMLKLLLPAKLIFKGIMLLLPLLWITKIIIFFANRKKYTKEYINCNTLIIILYSYALSQMGMYSLLGALMDRYAVAAYTTTLVGFVFDIYVNIFKRKSSKILGEITSGSERLEEKDD